MNSISVARNFVDVLRYQAAQQPDKCAFTYLASAGGSEIESETRITYAELDQRARAIGAILQKAAKAGDRALLLYPSGLEYIAAFMGCLYAGVIAVPSYPPKKSQSRQARRVQALAADSKPSVVLTSSELKGEIQELQWEQGHEFPQVIFTDAISSDACCEWQEANITAESLAFLQYTSGSTSTPKGVMITHANLLHNEECIRTAFGQNSSSIIVSWLPLYHDMGLIGSILQTMYVGATCVLLSPVDFLRQPRLWLETISRFRATTSGGPDFSYDLCVKKIQPEQRKGLDLKTWEVAFNGAEPVRSETLLSFAEAFADCGFRLHSFRPCYGLAEATLMVAAGDGKIISFHKQTEAEPGSLFENSSRTLVGCGEVHHELEVAIVNPETFCRCEPREVGEVWISSPSVARGYWNREEETRQVFGARIKNEPGGPYLRTGDMGVKNKRQLFIVGRLKDLIIVRGRNLYPEDLELLAQGCDEGLRRGSGAAFSVDDDGQQRIVLVQEVSRTHKLKDPEAVAAKIRETISRECEAQISEIIFVKEASLPKTSSGKLQRHLYRKMFIDGELKVIANSAFTQDASTPQVTPIMAQVVKAMPRDQQQQWAEAYLKTCIAQVLRRGCPDLDPSAPVASLGLDSLMVLELQNKVESDFGVRAGMDQVLEGCSLRQLAERMVSDLGSEVSAVPVRKNESVTSCPLSHGQQALWYLYQLAPESTAYNIARAARIAGDLDVAVLKKAFQTLAQRHSCLRTTFFEAPEGPIQRVHEEVDLEVPVEQISGGQEELERKLFEEARQPFNLCAGPVFRIKIFEVAPHEHVLLLAVHHIVSDLWSLVVMLRELGALYSSAVEGTVASLPELKVNYSDYVQWQSELLASPRGAELESFWREEFSTGSTVLDLPADHPRPAIKTFRGAIFRSSIGQNIAAHLKQLAVETGTTLYMVLLAAFDVMLHRYTNQSDIPVLSVVTGRTRPEFENLVGYVVNPLLTRISVDSEMTFHEVVYHVRERTARGFKHQDYPFSLLIPQLRQQAAAQSGYPEVMFTMQKTIHGDEPWPIFALGNAGAKLNLGKLQLESIVVPQDSCQFDLMLAAAETNEEIVFTWQYSTDLFNASTIRRMAGHMEHLLEEIARNSWQKVGHLSLLETVERQLILEEWNATSMQYEPGYRLHELFELQAQKTPDAVALVYGTHQVTYAQLNATCNELARALLRKGLQQGEVVGICAERSLAMVFAMVAVLKAGGAYLPLEPSYPPERLQVMIQDAGVHFVLSRPEWQSRLPEGILVVTLPERENRTSSADDLHLKVHPRGLAYVIYTSGSTGRPKGVMVSHESIVNRLQWMQQSYQLKPSDTVLQKTPFSFDVSVWEFFWPLITGARLVLAAPGEHRDNERLVKLISQNNVTTIHFVPSMLEAFLEFSGFPGCGSLERVICSGEALTRDLVRKCAEKLPWTQLHNLYGPTEAAVDVTSWPCDLVSASDSVPIGRPIANTQIYILDDYFNPVPAGVVGELYIGGKGVARGYCSRSSLTAEKFVPDPFGMPGKRLYRTGDLARFRADGLIDFLGRMDHQVKIRGFRIEPAEIESVLCRHPQVKQAVVLAKKLDGEQQLVSYVVLRDKETASISQLRSFLKDKLPEYMVPYTFIFLKELPLNSNGKLDKKALPSADHMRPDVGVYVPPQTATEEILAGIWAKVLGVQKVGVQDNYFDLGGDSIRSIQVVGLSREHGLQLQLSDLLQYQTIQELAAAAKQANGSEHSRTQPFELISEEDCLRLPSDVVDAYPLSALQAGLVFHSEFRPDYVVYSVSAHLRAPLDTGKMQAVLAGMVSRHELLRTRYDVANPSQPLQLVQATAQVPFEVEDLRSLSPEKQERKLQIWLELEKHKKFDWTKAPFLRVRIHQRTDESFQFTFTHPLFDGWSTASLITEFFVAYFRMVKGEPMEDAFTPLSSAYREFVALEMQALRDPECQNYWRRQMDSCPGTVLALPTYNRRDPGQLPVRVTRVIPEETFKGLRQLARDAGVPIKSVLLAVHVRAVSLITGAQNIMTGLICNGRPDHIDGEKVPGLFLNTPPLRMCLNGGTWKELVQSTFAAEREMHPFRRYPYSKLQRDNGDKPLFDTAFNLINFHVYNHIQQIPEMELLRRDTSYDQTFFPFTAYFELDIFSSRALFHIDVSTETIDDEQMATMAGYYMNIMDRMAEAPMERYDSMCLLEGKEAHRLLVEWNTTQTEKAEHQCVHAAVETWSQQAPANIALCDDGQSLTYRDLNLRAEALAVHLRSMKAGPEAIVGVCMESSVDLVVAFLAVLKAGAAYLPLDPSLPRQRLAWMLQDSGARLLITKEKVAPGISGVPVVLMDGEWISAPLEPLTRTRVFPENLAYLIYTSGSTGQPKGVAVTHRGLANLVQWHNKNYAVVAADKATQLARLSFDACVWELWPYLAAGASVHFPPAGTLDSPVHLMQWLAEKEITISFLPTPLAEAVLQEEWLHAGKLRALLTGGDRLHRGPMGHEGFTLHNNYGPTENTVVATSGIVAAENRPDAGAPTIGRPIANNEVYVLNASLQPVPTGVVGELYIGGESLARGYLYRPDLTAERFVPNPFSSTPGQRLYRTGDLVRYTRKGELDFVGRDDHQVKMRGLRIELGEIEAALLEFQGVRQAAVVMYQQPTQHLASYIVAQTEEDISVPALREYLSQRLPIYMVPSSFTFLTALPLTHNGKIDRQELLAHPPTQIRPIASYVAPRTPLEEHVARIWSRTLEREGIGINDNFFELGGHSLTATQIISRVSNELGVCISLRTLFETPTIEGMAAAIEAQQRQSEAHDLDEILAEIDTLSDEEVLHRIAKHTSSNRVNIIEHLS